MADISFPLVRWPHGSHRNCSHHFWPFHLFLPPTLPYTIQSWTLTCTQATFQSCMEFRQKGTSCSTGSLYDLDPTTLFLKPSTHALKSLISFSFPEINVSPKTWFLLFTFFFKNVYINFFIRPYNFSFNPIIYSLSKAPSFRLKGT